jgi:M6 family metalloprotease-like protein/uncharacterized repeat protein (TIGR02543 family)
MALSVRPALVAAALLVLAAVQPAEAQYPRARPGQFEIRGMDFRARGGWRQRSANVRAQRQSLLATGNLAMLNSQVPGMAGTVVTGQFFVPVVPILFANTDTTTIHPVSEYQDLFFSPNPAGRPYSVKTYYEQLTHNRITMSGTVFPWVRVDSSDTYYEDNCNGVGVGAQCPHGGEPFAEMILQALSKASSGADSATVWAQFDNDGPDGIPNSGDDDGVVDFVTFLQPDVDGACGTPHIWAHRYVVDYWNGGSPFVTKTRSNSPGHAFITISDYTIQSGLGGDHACSANAIMPIGTVTHETGHAFGLPDLYDTSQQTQGVGEWDLMGSGNYSMPYSPSRMGAWSLAELGWTTVDTLKTSGTITLDPVATSDTVRLLRTQTPGEYFLFEDRAAIQSDSAQMNPANPYLGSHLKKPGLVVWHIDQSRISAGSFDNSVNVGSIQGVAVVQADGLNELRTPGLGDRGDTGDSYPGSTNNTALDGYTNPALLTNGGKVVPGRLDSIAVLGNGAVQFRFRMEYGLQVTRFGTGTGTIIASVPGDPLSGLGAPVGSVVTLTARPSAGHKFVGWTGDTTSSDTVLVLTMDRNRTFLAQFSYTAPFTTTAAATDLLGAPALSAAQRLVLDQAGNHNGVYDLGDFLAWVTATAQGVPPALMARLLAAESAPKGVTQ